MLGSHPQSDLDNGRQKPDHLIREERGRRSKSHLGFEVFALVWFHMCISETNHLSVSIVQKVYLGCVEPPLFVSFWMICESNQQKFITFLLDSLPETSMNTSSHFVTPKKGSYVLVLHKSSIVNSTLTLHQITREVSSCLY